MKQKPKSRSKRRSDKKSWRGLNLKEGQYFAAFVPKKRV